MGSDSDSDSNSDVEPYNSPLFSGDEEAISSSNIVQLPRRKKAVEPTNEEENEEAQITQETYIDVPYHRPKPHSLEEFLNRKTVNRPKIRPIDKRGRRTIQQIKMTPYELFEYA